MKSKRNPSIFEEQTSLSTANILKERLISFYPLLLYTTCLSDASYESVKRLLESGFVTVEKKLQNHIQIILQIKSNKADKKIINDFVMLIIHTQIYSYIKTVIKSGIKIRTEDASPAINKIIEYYISLALMEVPIKKAYQYYDYKRVVSLCELSIL